MKQQRWIIMALALAASSAMANTALPPLLVNGPTCPAGSARLNKWVVFEDRNGDGTYDFVVSADCDGAVRGRDWDVHVDPLGADGTVIGQLPIGTVGAAPDLTYTGAGGAYTWVIVERIATGAEVCRITRDAHMTLSSTCGNQQLR